MKQPDRRCGQAIVEYLMVSSILILMMVVMAVFLHAFREQAGRVLDLVASVYP